MSKGNVFNSVRCNCGKIFDVAPLTYDFNNEPIKRIYICKCGKRYYQKPNTHIFPVQDSFITEVMPEDLEIIDICKPLEGILNPRF